MKQGIFTSNLHHLLASDTLWFMNGSICLKTTCPCWKNCVLAVACLADKPRIAWKRRPCCASGAVWDAHLALHDTLAHSLQGPRAWKAALSLFGNATVAGLEPNAISLSSSAASLSYHIFGWFKCLRTCGTSIYRCNVFTVRIVSFLVRFLLSPCQHWYFLIFTRSFLHLSSSGAVLDPTRISALLRLLGRRSRQCSPMEENFGVCWHKDLAHDMCVSKGTRFGSDLCFSMNLRFAVVCCL